MRNDTRLAYNAFVAKVAELNSVSDATVKFTVAPSVQQILETKMQESSSFLQSINLMPVDDQSGELLGLGIDGPIASRTNTATNDRAPRDPSGLTGRSYLCRQTNSDTALKYAKIDAWAKFPDFQTRIRDAIIKRQALDRILIGFRGVSAAAATDLVAHPLLEDVNIGWLQQLRTDAPARVLSDGASAGANAVKVGTGAGNDYRSLDSLVYDAIQLLDPIYREDPGLVAYVGRDLLHDKYFGLMNDAANDGATDQLSRAVIMSEKKLGGLPAGIAPFMIPNGVFITNPANLSIYFQTGGRRRTLVDNPKRDQIENYESSNDAYVIEELGAAALVENIVLS